MTYVGYTYAPDHSSRLGAQYLVRRLREYWKRKGISVTFRFEVISDHAEKPIYCIRSNLGERQCKS